LGRSFDSLPDFAPPLNGCLGDEHRWRESL
jgi:hypothetical protein